MSEDQGARDSTERLSLVRELVLEAALEVLERDGLGLQAESISYAKVFALLGEHGVKVGRGSVHGRIWDSHEDFRIEVLTAAIQHNAPDDGGPGVHKAILAILRMIDAEYPDLDHRGRVRAFSRMAGHGLLLGYLHSGRFRRFQAIKAAARGGADTAGTLLLRAMVKQRSDGNQAERAKTFGYMFQALGLQGRRDLELDDGQAIELFMTLVQVLVSGSHLDHYAGFTAMASKVETDLPGDDNLPWTYFGFGFLAAIEMLFEEKPGASPDLALIADEISNDSGGSVEGPARTVDLSELINGKPRRTREELRQLVVTAGVQLLLRDGLGLRAESLGYASVFAHIRQTRGISFHRSTVHPAIWSSQDEFRADVLAESARYGTDESLTTMKQAMAAQQVARNPDGSVNVRQLILDNSRATTAAQMKVAATSPTYRRWQSIKASMLSRTPEENADDLQAAVNVRYEEMLSAFGETYRSVLPLVGLQVNPDLKMSEDQAYHLFSVICATLSTGSDFNISAGAMAPGRMVALPRVDGTGRSDDWTVPAIGAQAILDLLFVPGSAQD